MKIFKNAFIAMLMVFSIQLNAQDQKDEAKSSENYNLQLNLNCTPVITLSDDSLLCGNETVTVGLNSNYSNYMWSTGATSSSIIATKGYYSVTVTDSAGCIASLDSIRIDSVGIPTPFLGNDTTICSGDSILLAPGIYTSYSWSNNSLANFIYVDTLGAYSVEVTDSNGCKGSHHIEIIGLWSKPNFNLGQDTSLCVGNSLTIQIPSVFSVIWNDSSIQNSRLLDTSGVFIAYISDVNNCKNSDTLEILNLFPLSTFSLGNDTFHCSGSQVTLSGPSFGSSFLWSNGNTLATNNVSGTGNYWLKVHDANGCESVDTMSIFHVQVNPSLNLPTAVQHCVGESSVLTGPSGNLIYFWSDSSNTQSITVKSANTYLLMVTDSLGCNSIDSVVVLENPLPVFDFGADVDGCLESNSQIQINGPLSMTTYNWSTMETSQNISFCTKSGLCPNVLGIGSSLLWLQVTDVNGCVYSDTTTVTIRSNPKVDLGTDTVLCSDEIVMFNFSVDSIYSSITWNGTATGPMFTSNDFGQIWVEVIDTFGCIASDSVNIDSASVPYFSLGRDTTIYPGAASLILDPMLPNADLMWSTGETTRTLEIEYQPVADQTVWLLATSYEGCTQSDTILIAHYYWSVEDNMKKLGVEVYPNPTAGLLNVNFTDKLPTKLELYSLQGQIVLSEQVKTSNFKIDLHQYSSGSYLIKLNFKDKTYTLPVLRR